MFELLNQGGPLMWVFPILSVIAVAIIADRFLYLQRLEKERAKLLPEWEAALKSRQWESFLTLCHVCRTPMAELLKTAHANLGQPPEVFKEVMLQRLDALLPYLDRHVVVLGTLASISPLLGLLGTVVGNIQAFDVLNRLQGVGDPAKLAGGIASALLTTVGGIVVAVPCVIFYNYFAARINRLESELRDLVLQIAARLETSR